MRQQPESGSVSGLVRLVLELAKRGGLNPACSRAPIIVTLHRSLLVAGMHR